MVSNPYREFISRAHGQTEVRDQTLDCFKPLSGIHLARTCTDQRATGNAQRAFQTPIGNSSRAHPLPPVTLDQLRSVSNPYREFISRAQDDPPFEGGQQLVSNPYREFISRARDEQEVLVLLVIGFKPLSGIHLARTTRREGPYRGRRRVSNPYREFISRAL